jgi:hypothetical protein
MRCTAEIATLCAVRVFRDFRCEDLRRAAKDKTKKGGAMGE